MYDPYASKVQTQKGGKSANVVSGDRKTYKERLIESELEKEKAVLAQKLKQKQQEIQQQKEREDRERLEKKQQELKAEKEKKKKKKERGEDDSRHSRSLSPPRRRGHDNDKDNDKDNDNDRTPPSSRTKYEGRSNDNASRRRKWVFRVIKNGQKLSEIHLDEDMIYNLGRDEVKNFAVSFRNFCEKKNSKCRFFF